MNIIISVNFSGNQLYPLKVSAKPVSGEDHTVTLFYAVPVSSAGTQVLVLQYYCYYQVIPSLVSEPVVQGAGFHSVADVIENDSGSYPLQHTHR